MNLKLKHKKLYALLVVLCLVLSMALLLTACRNNNKPDDNNDDDDSNNQVNKPTYTGGPEDGAYYYDVADGEISLELSGGKFTIAGPGYDNKTGSYSVDGTTMAFDFDKDEDGTATATISGDTIALSYNNATMTFLKKIPFTVTFNVDGGSAIAPVTVVNGKTAVKPADPTKPGYVFLGWYADSALTTTYAFTSPVKANTTLYAKWVKVEDGPVYNVSFDLGYDGAPAINGVETVNGIVYNLPENLTRDGYTFAGWWISMFEDGNKLSYKYADGSKLNSDTTLFALWIPNNAVLAAPIANASANGISWTPVSGANTYSVVVKDANGEEIINATTSNYNYAFNFNNAEAGEYSFEIVAKGTSGKTSEPTVRYYNNKALDRVSGLAIKDGKLVFNAVTGAEKYLISINCGNKEHNHDAFDNGLSTYYDFANCSMQAGGIKFTVVAVAEGYANSIPSAVFTYEKNLAPMGTVTYANDSFTWTAVENATGYVVVITVGGNSYTFKCTETSFSTADFTGTISVAVTPVADGYNSPAAATATATKTAPAAVQNLAASNTTLTWNATAESYVITINGKQYTTTETTFDLASKLTELNLQAGETYTVSVTAVAGGEQSAAATISVISAAMSSTLTYSDKVVYWPAVLGYSNFKVRVNGGEEITVAGKNFAQITFTKAGENVIEVICTDLTSDWTNASKITVTAYEVKYATRSEAGEFVEYLANGDTLTPPTGMTVNGRTFSGWYNTPLAAEDNGKKYTEDKFYGSADTTLYANWTPNKYTITIDVDDTYISSPADGTTAEVTYTKPFKLPVPVCTDETKGFFVGWFNALNGEGIQLTDDLGNSIEPYGIIGDSTVYPFFAEALSYLEVKDENDNVVGYYVTKGRGITNKSVTEIVIPALYNNKPIIGIADNAFHSCYHLETVDFPDTVEYVGEGAFELCNKLLSINMYDADPNFETDTPYSTHDGALIYYHEASNATYLEVFPSAKTGEYTVANGVNIIGPNAFKNSKISKVIISKCVTTVSKNAFVNCTRLTEIEFEFEREGNVAIEDGAFAETPNVTTIILPAKLALLENIKIFDVFEDLATITIENGGENYASVNNLICDPFGTKLLYVPRSFKGEFEVPYGITAIGNELFLDNPNITKVIIGEHVQVIGVDAFRGCSGLTEVVIKTPRESIFTIDTNAFYGCSNLKNVIIEGSDVTDANENMPIYISDYAFANCTKLQTVEIGNNAIIFELGEGAFRNCSALESFTIADSATLENIGDSAFNGCSGLTKFTIHGTTKSIGNSAFEGCSRLNTISLGEGTSDLALGKDVFKDCVRLANIELPASLTAFDPSLFNGCENIQNINVDSSNTYLESIDGVLYTKGGAEIIYYPRTRDIPDGIVDLTDANLKKIGPSVFKNNPKVKTVKIGASVEEIANGAFDNCINLTKVEFTGENAKFTIGAYAFANCSQLSAITIPAATTRIGGYAFDHTALAAFEIPAAVTYVGYNAFAYTNLTEITIPANVTVIGHGAFYNASKLATVTFAPRTADIEIGKWDDDDAKANDISFIPDNGVFSGTALNSISIPKQAISIGNYAFYNLASLTSVTLDSEALLETIGEYAFASTGISEINLSSNSLKTIDAYAFANTKLVTVNIPASVQYIKGHAFSTSTLTGITFTEGPAEGIGLHISNGAFTGANLTSIHFPAQLKALGEAADKYGYTAISVFYDKIPTANSSTFDGNANLTTITVSENNITYTVIDGVLYRVQGYNNEETGEKVYVPTRLLFSPTGNLGNGGTVTVPKTVTMVDYTAFLKTKLTSIIFEEYDKEDPHYGVGSLAIGYLDSPKIDNACPPVISGHFGEIDGKSQNYTTLKLIQFPSHLSAIRNGTLNGLYANTAELVMKFNPDSLVKFGAYGMRNSSAIKRIELPKLAAVETYAFYGFGGLSELTFTPGSTATSIGYRAFENCMNLTSFTLPASVTSIGDMAFYQCSKLIEFKVEEGSQLQTIGNKAFYGLASQVEGGINFVIPATVEVIGSQVFYRANIKELTLSENIIIEGGSDGSIIEGCDTIEKIHVPDNHPTLSSFDGIVYDKNCTAIYLIPSMWSAETYEIPDTVQTIAAGTFANFKGSYIKLPAALTAISDKAFQYAQITHIEIPDNVVSIGNFAFNYCSKLTTVTISANSKLTSIGDQAFSRSAITGIYLPDSITSIGYSAFESASSLQSVKLPAGLKNLESSTFKNCASLESVELNDGLESIGNSAFAGSATGTKISNRITKIVIPDSVISIDRYAFSACTNLKEFYCSDASQLIYVGEVCFYKCTALEKVVFGPNVRTFAYSNVAGNIFSGCDNLKEIVLPSEMTKIPDGFLANLANLEKLTLPTQLEELGIDALRNCPKLTTITLPASLSTIGTGAFAQCSGLESVVFEDGSKLQIISSNAFAECTSLKTINLPDTIIEIGDSAFAKTAFTTITLPSSLDEIGAYAFYECASLTTVNVPASVSIIGADAFAYCQNLESVTLNSGLKTIGSYAFAQCTKITAITIPDTVTTIYDNPFIGCVDLVLTLDANNTNFTYVEGVLLDETGYTLIYYSPANTATTYTIPVTVAEIAGGAFANSKLESIVISERIKAISAYAFSDSKSLKTIVIPASVTTVDTGAFMGCSALESITIPASVTYIGDSAFANCTSLSTFTLAERKDNITVGAYLFYGCESITKTYEFPGVTDFTPYMYAGTGITSITFADNTNYNVEGVFANSALTTVTFGEMTGTMNNLGNFFFAGSKLTSVVIPEGFHVIGKSAFANCESLVSVTISSRSISDNAFENCKALINFTVLKPASLDPREEFTVGVGEGAFANDTALSNTNIFDFVYQYSKEAFLNCSSLTGEISLNNRLGSIGDYAFSGTNFTKITINGREFSFYEYALAGLTEATTVYFASANSLEALIERMGNNDKWVANTTAKLTFYTPSSDVEVTLTDEELKTLDTYVNEGMIDKSMVETVKEKWLAYKASFVTLSPSKELTKEEIAALDEFANSCKISEKLKTELPKMWIEYRMNLAKELTSHPKYFTEEELKSFDELAGKMAAETQTAFKQAWFEYKLAYNDANPSDTVGKDEMELVYNFCKELGLDTDFANELINRWPAYKKTLAAGLVKPVYIDLTADELKALENFCKNWSIPDALEDLKLGWMEYKGALVISGKEDAAELNADEIALVNTMISTYGLNAKLATELQNSLLKYKQTYADYIMKSVPLTDEENKMVEEFLANAGLSKEMLAEIQNALLAYKKAFYLSGFQPGKELSEDETAKYNAFMEKYGVDAKLVEKFMQTFMEYRLKLAGK